MIFWAMVTTLCNGFLSHADTMCKNALYGVLIKGHKQFLCEVVVSQYPQIIESLLCLFDDGSGVGTPSQVVFDVHTNEADVGGLLHMIPNDEQGLDVCFLLLKSTMISFVLVVFKIRLFSLHHTDMLNLVPVCRLLVPYQL